MPEIYATACKSKNISIIPRDRVIFLFVKAINFLEKASNEETK